jgi:hypothetical protein
MNLSHMLVERQAAGEPVRIGVIGAGAFGTMFLAQAHRTPGLHVVGVADLDAERARTALARTGWPQESYRSGSVKEAVASDGTCVTADPRRLMDSSLVDVIVEATGSPVAGMTHALGAFDAGCHVVMVTVEADAVAGPLLAQRAADAGVVYSMAYGDQPALICELVDWARTTGFEVVAAGKGTRYLPSYHASTPDTVWGHYGLHVLCDLSIAADSARFGQTGPRVGSFDAGFGTAYLARVVGEKRAREIWMLCRQYDAETAERWGLVNQVVPADELRAEVRRWADEILALSPTALRFVKQSFNVDTEQLAGVGKLAFSGLGLFVDSDEAAEGVGAFAEKRAPDFSRYRARASA